MTINLEHQEILHTLLISTIQLGQLIFLIKLRFNKMDSLSYLMFDKRCERVQNTMIMLSHAKITNLFLHFHFRYNYHYLFVKSIFAFFTKSLIYIHMFELISLIIIKLLANSKRLYLKIRTFLLMMFILFGPR